MECIWNILNRIGLSSFLTEKVFEIMRRYERDGCFNNIFKYELAYLPIHYYAEKVKPCHLAQIWFQLPSRYHKEDILLRKLPCFEHYNLDIWATHMDGPPPSKIDCSLCNLNKK